MVEEGRTQGAARGLGPWLRRIAPRSARGTLTIAILPNARVKALNRKYRGKNAGTDVLSFPGTGTCLGDIAISREIAQKQARLLRHPLRTELRVLALHGLLHLLGYDHESDNGRMALVEARLRRKARLPPGLIARS